MRRFSFAVRTLVVLGTILGATAGAAHRRQRQQIWRNTRTVSVGMAGDPRRSWASMAMTSMLVRPLHRFGNFWEQQAISQAKQGLLGGRLMRTWDVLLVGGAVVAMTVAVYGQSPKTHAPGDQQTHSQLISRPICQLTSRVHSLTVTVRIATTRIRSRVA